MLSQLNDEYLKVFPSIQVISVFESVNYEFYDFDALGPSQRSYLVKKLGKIGFIQRTGKWLHHSSGMKIYIPGSKIFNRNFVSFLADETPGGDIWFATTPTQAAYLLFKHEPFEFEDLAQLMTTQPFNLERLLQATSHEHFYPRILQYHKELQRLHERAKILLKNKTPLGGMG